mmetsp:Transcript_56142/g.119524  ORF Transcript_56142/g.119524 Transcript_56142/m.119524 type:complete len:213 (+) Transcript_56142:79-717(+)
MSWSGGPKKRAGYMEAWDKMYEKRDKEKAGIVPLQSPAETIRKMYDKLVQPALAKRGANVPLPTEQSLEEEAEAKAKAKAKKSAKEKKRLKKEAKKRDKKQKKKERERKLAKKGKKEKGKGKKRGKASSSSSSTTESSSSSEDEDESSSSASTVGIGQDKRQKKTDKAIAHKQRMGDLDARILKVLQATAGLGNNSQPATTTTTTDIVSEAK